MTKKFQTNLACVDSPSLFQAMPQIFFSYEHVLLIVNLLLGGARIWNANTALEVTVFELDFGEIGHIHIRLDTCQVLNLMIVSMM